MKRVLVSAFLALFAMSASAECTGLVTIEKLYPRAQGWIHVQAAGMTDMDIRNCGTHNFLGLLLNFNDTNGTAQGKKMLYSSLLTAFATGKKLMLCSSACDTQHPTFSELSYINELQ